MRKLENLSDQEIEEKINEWEKLCDEAFNSNMPTNDYIKRLNELSEIYSQYRAEKNMRKTPTYTEYSELDLDCRMSLEDFVNGCKHGFFTNYDGFGYFASNDGVTDIGANTDDIRAGVYRKDFPYVCWYNK